MSSLALIPFFWDPTFLMLIPAMVLALWAQGRVRNTYNKFSQVPSRGGRSGAEVARDLLARRGCTQVAVNAVSGTLSDHYDPRTRSVNLSEANFHGNSLAALAIAAHETGHALQHRDEWLPLVLRGRMAPVVGFGSTLAFPLFFIGFIFSSMRILMDVGIIFFALAVVFHLVTLPVEFDASRRAMVMLTEGGSLQKSESDGARKVLSAAAWTYVAAATMALSQLIRLLILRGARD